MYSISLSLHPHVLKLSPDKRRLSSNQLAPRDVDRGTVLNGMWFRAHSLPTSDWVVVPRDVPLHRVMMRLLLVTITHLRTKMSIKRCRF